MFNSVPKPWTGTSSGGVRPVRAPTPKEPNTVQRSKGTSKDILLKNDTFLKGAKYIKIQPKFS